MFPLQPHLPSWPQGTALLVANLSNRFIRPPADPEEMTVCSYDQGELRKFVTQIVLGVAICSFIHFKFDVVQPLFIQVVMAPFTLWETALFKVLVLKFSEQQDSALKRPFVVKDQNPFASYVPLLAMNYVC